MLGGLHVETWLARETVPCRPFIVRLAGDPLGLGLAQGHWVVVADSVGCLKRVGRVLRIRVGIEVTVLYLDSMRALQKTVSLADIGLTLPTGLVTRLRPEDLVHLLRALLVQ